MKKISSITLFFLTITAVFAQKPIEKDYATFESFLQDQQASISAIENGSSAEEVDRIMGGPIVIKVPKTGKMKKLKKLLNQPEFANKINRGPKRQIEIRWFFSSPKNGDGIISKKECTPVIIENGNVVGKGWDFFNAFRKTL